MAKRFDIHEWQAKQRLAEQEEFTPDLEDDDLKRAKIQQMMNTEKGLQKDDYKLVNSISNVADMYSYGEILDALESFYIKNDEQPFVKMARKHAKEFRDFLDSEDGGKEDEKFMGDWGPHLAEDEIDEANVTGGGASFTTGTGGTGAYATPKAVSKGKKKKAPYRKSGYMGDSAPVKENEENEKEEFGRDVKALEKLIDDKINTKDEWVDMFQVLMAHSEEIRDLNDSQIKILLQQSLKDI